MTKIMKVALMAQLATVLLLVAAVGNTRAAPTTENPCTSADVAAASNSFSSWISSFTSQGYEPAAVALSIFSSCNTNGDFALDQTELTTCLQNELTVPISDSCFSLLLDNLDVNSDDVVNLNELVLLITSLDEQGQRRRNNSDKRNHGLGIRLGLEEEGMIGEARSNSDASSRNSSDSSESSDSSDSSESSGDDSSSFVKSDWSDRSDWSDSDASSRDSSDSSESSESSGDDSDSYSREDLGRQDADSFDWVTVDDCREDGIPDE